MKPGSCDIRRKILITGEEFRELKRHTDSMAEAFGLDGKIEAYTQLAQSPCTAGIWIA
jgi:hypothetical protein